MNRVTFGKIKQVGRPERLVPIIYHEGSSTILKVDRQLKFSKGQDNMIMIYNDVEYETGIPTALVDTVETFYPIKYAFGIEESYYNALLKKVI